MNYTEAKNVLSALSAKDEYTEEEKAQVNEIHRIIYKCDVADCNCKNKYNDAVIKMLIWFKNNAAFSTCHYVMARGEAFMVGLTYYNNSNLTDEVAEKLIAENERAKQVITRIDYEDEATAETPAEVKETASNDEQSIIPRRKRTKK